MGFFDLFKKKKTPTTAINTFDSKEDIMRTILQNMSKKTPSEHFASGAVFDITRQNHNLFEKVVNSSNAGALGDFFINAYVAFINQPQIVGFSRSMIDNNLNDTNPRMWNADIMMLSSGEKIALCFMPIISDVYAARIIGIVLGNAGDRYYYCMLRKDENTLSDVIQNKAMLGIEKIGSVKGRGFELMKNFIECINNN